MTMLLTMNYASAPLCEKYEIPIDLQEKKTLKFSVSFNPKE